jgi:hypothetical protein
MKPDAREVRARQLVLAADELDAWAAKFKRYHTTTESCDCPDNTMRRPPGGCKHILALRLIAAREIGVKP